MEGKEYVVKDGDVLLFKFNVLVRLAQFSGLLFQVNFSCIILPEITKQGFDQKRNTSCGYTCAASYVALLTGFTFLVQSMS